MKLSCSNTENNLLAKRINDRAADREQSVGGAFHTMNSILSVIFALTYLHNHSMNVHL